MAPKAAPKSEQPAGTASDATVSDDITDCEPDIDAHLASSLASTNLGTDAPIHRALPPALLRRHRVSPRQSEDLHFFYQMATLALPHLLRHCDPTNPGIVFVQHIQARAHDRETRLLYQAVGGAAGVAQYDFAQGCEAMARFGTPHFTQLSALREAQLAASQGGNSGNSGTRRGNNGPAATQKKATRPPKTQRQASKGRETDGDA